ncbi:hypothetical protein HYPSUDRAFT_39648 [Hypholoma sublateritium FD-334 SS-4]|uniref:Major facilitator superfamily (MFS) profile domain-containing protein n=1 Tax=Hypholoma sublateritium (strain FD-334 SS-4) TaxID=945553 RepID=A0A0D2L9B0_HYPSF|nr:hypothetical protein HYPSUDRAFT_39648 [Hypholoma sublateritium FD-334 SS-4]
MKGFDFNIALTIFYVSVSKRSFLILNWTNTHQRNPTSLLHQYTLADIPSTIIMKQVGSIWIAILVLLFGVVTLGTAFIKTYGQLIATRILLGVFEAGTLPSLVYLLSRYYRRKELVIRTGIFFGTAPTLAGAFGGLLASGLLSLQDFGPVKSWRKIFFVEGIVSIGVGSLLLFFMPGDSLKTRFLNEEERRLTVSRLNADAIVKIDGRREPASVILVLRSFNIWTALCSIGYLMVNVSFQGLSLFLPTVVNSLGHYTVVQAQLRTVPPYAIALVWNMVIIFWSFYAKQRGIPIIASLLLEIAGYAIAISTKNPHARYAACFFSFVGSEPCGPMFLIWGTDNAAPDTMRAVTAGTITGVGTIGSIIAVWAYLPKDSPNFRQGNSLNLGAACIAVAVAALGVIYIRWENGSRDRGKREHRLTGKTEEEVRVMGYRHPKFRYQI